MDHSTSPLFNDFMATQKQIDLITDLSRRLTKSDASLFMKLLQALIQERKDNWEYRKKQDKN